MKSFGDDTIGWVEEFKSLAEDTKPSIVAGQDIASLYSHYGIPEIRGVYKTKDITDHLFNKIPKLLECEGEQCELNHYLIKKIKEHILLEHFFYGNSLEPYKALEIIFDSTRSVGSIIPFSEESKWKEVIQAALDFNTLMPRNPNLKKDHPRLYNLSKAAKFFQKKGYEIRIEDSEVKINESDLKTITNEIEDTIRCLSGFEIINKMLNQLSPLYDKVLGRFLLNRANGYGENPLFPIGYLFNLSAKNTAITPMRECEEIWDYEFKHLLNLVTQLCVIYNVQPYNNFQIMFKGKINIIEFIREIALFDSAFTLTQLRPSDSPRILNGLFKNLNPVEMKKELGFGLEDLIRVIEEIFKLTKDFTPITFNKSDLSRLGGEKVIKKILDVFSCEYNNVNEDYFLPVDKPDFMFKPLIKTENNRYILLNSSWRATTFYEALSNELRSKDSFKSSLEETIGSSLEEFIIGELSKKRIQCKSGHYKMSGIEGQCDVIIESDATIVFIEIKKKSLTRMSQSGDEITLVLDLSKSLLDAQLQINKHEILLRKFGFIEFDDRSRLECNDRNIEKISLTLLDYGGFQDKIVINQILDVLLRTDLSVRTPKYEPEFKNLREKTDTLRKQLSELAKLDKMYVDAPFFDSYFLSLPQLLLLIDDSKDTDSLIKKLNTIKTIGFNSLNFYYEYSRLKGITS